MNKDRDLPPVAPLADYRFATQALSSIAGIAADLEAEKLAEAISKASPANRGNLHRLALTILSGTNPELASAAQAFPLPTDR